MKQIMVVKPSDLIPQLFYIKGKPFSFKKREWLKPVYDIYTKQLLIKSGRQVGKSTFLSTTMIVNCLTHPFFTNLYITYSIPQISDFAIDKLNPLLEFSPYIKEYYTDYNSIKRVTEKTFINGSRISLRSMYRSADTIRGNAADLIAFDEVQDLIPEHIIVAKENLSASNYKYEIYSGTAKTGDNNIEELWNQSTQTEWLIKCEACGHYNYQDETIIGDSFYKCSKCGKQIYPQNGIWVEFNKTSQFKGFRITQIMNPTNTFEEIRQKLKTYPPDKFYNEVLGLPYDLSKRPILEKELIEICVPNRTPDYRIPHTLFGIMTIDWGSSVAGNSYTVLAIGYYFNAKIQIGYGERLLITDPLKQVDYIVELAKKSGIKIVLADYGFGVGQISVLKDKLNALGIHVYPVFYTESTTHARWLNDQQMYTLNRTWSLSDTFNTIKTKQIQAPDYSYMKDLFKDILSEFIDYRTPAHSELMYYTHKSTSPDDFLHAINYLVFGIKLFVLGTIKVG
ncbi:MAG: phage terminase large subunit family protein [Thermoplasmata archaeon]